MKKGYEIGKNISILKRLNDIYFAKHLSDFEIGCGQQFFLLQIYRNPGINLQELASFGHYDKATSTRAAKKLEKQGYVIIKREEEDKRIRRIYTTEKAEAVVNKTWEYKDRWLDIILAGFTEEEKNEAEGLLLRMADNAFHYINGHKRKD